MRQQIVSQLCLFLARVEISIRSNWSTWTSYQDWVLTFFDRSTGILSGAALFWSSASFLPVWPNLEKKKASESPEPNKRSLSVWLRPSRDRESYHNWSLKILATWLLGWRFCKKRQTCVIPQLARVALAWGQEKNLAPLQSPSSLIGSFFIRLGLKPSTIPWIKRLHLPKGHGPAYRLSIFFKFSGLYNYRAGPSASGEHPR